MINFTAIGIAVISALYLCCVNALASFVTLKRLNDHDGADSSGGISSEDYHTGQ